jgi:uncharacterized protein (TIGR00369 family)
VSPRFDAVREWIEGSPYARALGVCAESVSEEAVRLRLPFSEANANPGKALHGGCAASLAAIGAQAVGRAALGPEGAPWHTAALQVSYLAAAIGEEVTAQARLLRRGKKACFAEVEVATADGKPIAHATAMVRGRFGAPPALLPRAAGDDGATDPGRLGPQMSRLPFMAARGIRIEHMAGGRSRVAMPAGDANRDLAGGAHEGAVLALLDTTGAMASWAETGAGPFKASTPALQAQILAPAPEAALVAYGRVVLRDHEAFFADVEVAEAASGRVCARRAGPGRAAALGAAPGPPP